jgi:3-oxoacyl-[acyl-carrier protein] reductase
VNKSSTLIIGASSTVAQKLIPYLLSSGETIYAQLRSESQSILDQQQKHPHSLFILKSNLENDLGILGVEIKQIENLHKILFCAAPIPIQERFKNLKWSHFESDLNIQVKATIEILKIALPLMIKNGWGRVAFIFSSYVIGMPPAFMSPYVCSKYMLMGLMKSLSVEYAGKNITFNGIAPSMFQSTYIDHLPEFIKESSKEKNPTRRLGEVDDLIPSLELILNEKSSFLNGSIIPITGGESAF